MLPDLTTCDVYVSLALHKNLVYIQPLLVTLQELRIYLTQAMASISLTS